MTKFWRLELDYDSIPREDVDADAKRLIQEFPKLGSEYRIEDSKSRDHYHVIFLKSQFTSFNEAYAIALQSRADRDWLELCKAYECFGLETEASRGFNEARQQQQRIVNKPTKMILSPFILDLVPNTTLDGRRIVKICEAIDDPTWQYHAFVHIWNLRQHIEIGCRDERQAQRRLKWLTEQELNFVAEIKKNPINI